MKFNIYCFKVGPTGKNRHPFTFKTLQSVKVNQTEIAVEFDIKSAHEHMKNCPHGHELVPVW